MRNPQEGWLAAISVTIVTAVLVVTDLTDAGVAAWWARHSFTASVTGGILVLAVTVLIADRVTAARALKERSQAIAAQAAIVMSQAARATRAVKTALTGGEDDDVDAAADELRTYMTMLLLASSLLIDAHVSRTFLEQAQLLARDLARGVAAARSGEGTDAARHGLDTAVAQMREVSRPLLDRLDLESRTAVSGGDPASPETASP